MCYRLEVVEVQPHRRAGVPAHVRVYRKIVIKNRHAPNPSTLVAQKRSSERREQAVDVAADLIGETGTV